VNPRLPLRASRLGDAVAPVKLVLDGTERTLSAATPFYRGQYDG